MDEADPGAEAGWPYLPPGLVGAPDPRLLGLVPASVTRRHRLIPWRETGGRLDFLTDDPANAAVLPELAFALERDVGLMLTEQERLESLLTDHCGDGCHGGAVPAAAEPEAADAPVVRFVDAVLAHAVGAGASDIHFEPFEDILRIRYRIDGTLQDGPAPPRHLAGPVASRLKVLANLDIGERRLPQDGRINFEIKARAVDLRVSTLPTQFGESVVLRVLDRSNLQLGLDDLGLPEGARRGIEAVVTRPHGLLVVTGPTGSGKTTTLYGALRRINRVERKLLTVEDPVEYEIEGVMQVPVNAAIGLTFPNALRAFLRQDPDVVMIGEIRDQQSAEIAVQAALTGHLVLSTLHTSDTTSAITRLVELGVEPFLLGAVIEGVLAQRLVRRLCEHCREPVAAPPEGAAGSPARRDSRAIFRARGCVQCHGTGYRGRRALFEWLKVNEELREAIAAGHSRFELRRRAVAGGLRSLREEADAAVQAGDTTLEEIARHC